MCKGPLWMLVLQTVTMIVQHFGHHDTFIAEFLIASSNPKLAVPPKFTYPFHWHRRIYCPQDCPFYMNNCKLFPFTRITLFRVCITNN